MDPWYEAQRKRARAKRFGWQYWKEKFFKKQPNRFQTPRIQVVNLPTNGLTNIQKNAARLPAPLFGRACAQPGVVQGKANHGGEEAKSKTARMQVEKKAAPLCKKRKRPLSTHVSVLNPSCHLFADQGAQKSQRGECCKAEGFCEHTIPQNLLAKCEAKDTTVSELSQADNWLMYDTAEPSVKLKLSQDTRLVAYVVAQLGGNGKIDQSTLLNSYQQEATRVLLQ